MELAWSMWHSICRIDFFLELLTLRCINIISCHMKCSEPVLIWSHYWSFIKPLVYKFKNLRNIKNMRNMDLQSKLLNQFPDDPAIKMKNDHRLQYLKLKQYSFHPFSNFLRFSGVIKTFFNLWLDVNVFKYFSDQL